jgi:hypothetical protein
MGICSVSVPVVQGSLAHLSSLATRTSRFPLEGSVVAPKFVVPKKAPVTTQLPEPSTAMEEQASLEYPPVETAETNAPLLSSLATKILNRLAELFNTHWNLVNGNSEIRKADLERASQLSAKLMSVIAVDREVSLAEWANKRQQAWTLLHRAYHTAAAQDSVVNR